MNHKNSQTLPTLQEQVEQSWPANRWKDLTCIVGVSGGADSVALLRIVAELKQKNGGEGKIIAAHFNHGWRGQDSDEDAKFVEALAGDLGIPFRLGKVAGSKLTSPDQSPQSEESARNQRYDFLIATAHEEGARYLATAHTADDQVETVLHRILRGTGLKGLGGIPATRQLSESVSAIRPMLTIQREEVVAYLASIGQTCRTDSSNQDCKYTRNRIRHQLLPLLTDDYNPEVATALLRLGSLAQQSQNEIDRIVDEFTSRELTVRQNQAAGTEVIVRKPALQRLSRFLRCEVFKSVWSSQSWPMQSMGLEQWNKLADLADADDATQLMLPGTIVVSANKQEITLRSSLEVQ